VRSTTEHQRRRKPYLAPYRTTQDERYELILLLNVIMGSSKEIVDYNINTSW